jgi:predicted O-linked N-acetylglucosamine transferase (SPINDLY family)
LWILPKTYIAVDGFEIATPTLSRKTLGIPSDAVVYLTSQTAIKRHPETIKTQLKILNAVKNGYLLVKGGEDGEIIKKLFTQLAQLEGVDSNRLKFLEKESFEEIYRANLQIADVVLDTYPYNGATTTLEVLWLGIPIVTFLGEQFAARNSYSFMINAGITEGIASSSQEYVEWGIRLGLDDELRSSVHWKLIQGRKNSPLWKAKEFTKEMENAFFDMWDIYINSQD